MRKILFINFASSESLTACKFEDASKRQYAVNYQIVHLVLSVSSFSSFVYVIFGYRSLPSLYHHPRWNSGHYETAKENPKKITYSIASFS